MSLTDEILVPKIFDTGVPCGFVPGVGSGGAVGTHQTTTVLDRDRFEYVTTINAAPCTAQDALVDVKLGYKSKYARASTIPPYFGDYACCSASWGALTHPDLGLNKKAASKAMPGRMKLAAVSAGDGTCVKCGAPWTSKTGHVDHIVSRYQCDKWNLPGTLIHHPSNLQLLCADCNGFDGKGKNSDAPHPIWEQWVLSWRDRNPGKWKRGVA